MSDSFQRKAVRYIAVHGGSYGGDLYALCDDDTLWKLVILGSAGNYARKWLRMPDIPQEDEEPK